MLVKTFSILILCIVCNELHAQSRWQNIYPSKAERQYFDSLSQVKDSVKLVSIDEAMALNNNCIKVLPSPNKRNKFKSFYDETAYQAKYRRLYEECVDKSRKELQGRPGSPVCDYILEKSREEKVGNISVDDILRHDSLGSKHVFLYTDGELDEDDDGYWISISTDKGHSYKYYYTGLTENFFYYIKRKARIPFIKNDSVLQIEAALVHAISPRANPLPGRYELLKDNLALELNLYEIVKDTDNDGITDIEENRLCMDPFSLDTDGDGLPDSTDNNPRFSNVDNKHGQMYRYVLEGFSKDSIVPFNRILEDSINNSKLFRRTHLIVTDDSNLYHLSNTVHRYIFLTTNEYLEYSKRYKASLPHKKVSPMFPVDNNPNYFILHIDESAFGLTFLIIEKQDHWVVKVISRWIS